MKHIAKPCADAAAADSLNATAHVRAGRANLAFVGAGVAAIAAGVLWFTGKPESPVAVSARIGETTGVDVAVRF